MSQMTKPEDLSKEVGRQLQSWNQEFHNKFKVLSRSKAKKLAKTLRSTSPKRTGKYARSWTATETKNTTLEYRVTVHNKSHYQLIHLLEKPHQKRNGSRTTPKVHIQPARDKIEQEFINETEELIKKQSRSDLK